jgi:hypothetical protein
VCVCVCVLPNELRVPRKKRVGKQSLARVTVKRLRASDHEKRRITQSLSFVLYIGSARARDWAFGNLSLGAI